MRAMRGRRFGRPLCCHGAILAALMQSPGWALGLELGVGDSYESLLGQAQSCRRAVRAWGPAAPLDFALMNACLTVLHLANGIGASTQQEHHITPTPSTSTSASARQPQTRSHLYSNLMQVPDRGPSPVGIHSIKPTRLDKAEQERLPSCTNADLVRDAFSAEL
jgi:hypothetical protein